MPSFFKHEMKSRIETRRERDAAIEANWRRVCAIVDARDGRQCRCCDRRSDPNATGLLKRGHRHHIVYRSAGGPDTPENLVTLCADCHDAEHKSKLRIEGSDANGPLLFFRKGEQGEFVEREELAVRVVRRD